jgi:hypothetical protein
LKKKKKKRKEEEEEEEEEKKFYRISLYYMVIHGGMNFMHSLMKITLLVKLQNGQDNWAYTRWNNCFRNHS